MSFRLPYLIAAIFLFMVVAVSSKEHKCRISDHIDNITNTTDNAWVVNPRTDIFGNVTAESRRSRVSFSGTDTELEKAINEQINRELFAQYTYMSMAAHFARDDNYLPGFAKFFREAAVEEHSHAMMFMEYQNKRGWRVKLQQIKAPCKDEWGNGLMAMNESLLLERTIYQCLMDVHQVAETKHDHQMMDFIESNFLKEQIDSIYVLGSHVRSLERLDANHLGEYQFDKLTLEGKK